MKRLILWLRRAEERANRWLAPWVSPRKSYRNPWKQKDKTTQL